MNPNEVLGVSPTASEEGIKRIYRELAKKYHPDRYINSPIKDTAEKMQEINEAYDAIIKIRENAASGSQTNSDYYEKKHYAHYTDESQQKYEYIRRMILGGAIDQAEILLENMNVRDAEWFFLRGTCYLRRGWYVQAKSCMQTACKMDPDNQEYQQALYNLIIQSNGYNSNPLTMNTSSLRCLEMCLFLNCCCPVLSGNCCR